MKVIDLKFQIVDMGGKVEDLRAKETATEILIEIAADVLFDFDKFTIKPEAQATLNKAAQLLRDRGKGPIRIEGHTDGKGSDAYNNRLSLQRAEAVRTWLVSQGRLEMSRMSVVGRGSKVPVAPNTKPDGSDDPQGRQRNRRVEIVAAK